MLHFLKDDGSEQIHEETFVIPDNQDIPDAREREKQRLGKGKDKRSVGYDASDSTEIIFPVVIVLVIVLIIAFVVIYFCCCRANDKSEMEKESIQDQKEND